MALERGYEPAFGARPLKRLIQRELLDQLAGSSSAGSYGTVKLWSSTPTVPSCSSERSGAPSRRWSNWLYDSGCLRGWSHCDHPLNAILGGRLESAPSGR
jgi:hypothetical protein